MDESTQEIYLQKLLEFVFDEDKIITVSSTASQLNISIQDARILLNKFVEDHRQLKPKDLSITYVLSGKLKDGKGVGVYMVKETDLSTKKNDFEKVLSEVVYSVQKSNTIDYNMIALVDKVDEHNLRDKALLGSIVSKNCFIREIKKKNLPALPTPTIKGKSSFFVKTEAKPDGANKSTEKPAKVETKTKATGGIANMFSKMPQKPVTNKTKEPEKTPVKNSKTNGTMSGFFTKTSPTANKENNTQNKIESKEIKKESNMHKKDEDEVMEVDLDVNIKADKVKVEKESPDKKNKSKRKSKAKSGQEPPTKRRKRIVERNDSDSDDMFADDEPDDVIEKSEEEEEILPAPVVKPFAPKNKRRKAVDRTYEDEDGYIVTKTEYVYETASEDENEEPVPPPPPKKEEKPKMEKKNSSNSETDSSPQTKGGKGKKNKKAPATNQPTLFSMWKKK